MTSSIVKASTVKVGDRITEHDTPEGPFYAVVQVEAGSLIVDTGEADLRIPIRPTDVVRVAA